jgi:hypothetical protein
MDNGTREENRGEIVIPTRGLSLIQLLLTKLHMHYLIQIVATLNTYVLPDACAPVLTDAILSQ